MTRRNLEKKKTFLFQKKYEPKECGDKSQNFGMSWDGSVCQASMK